MKFSHSLISMIGVLISQIFFFISVYVIGKEFGPSALGNFNSNLSLASFLGGISALRLELACVNDSKLESQAAFLGALAVSVCFHIVILMLVLIGLLSFSVALFSFSFFLIQLITQYFVTKRGYTIIAVLKVFSGGLFLALLTVQFKEGLLLSLTAFDLYLLSFIITVAVYFVFIWKDNLRSWRMREGFFSKNVQFPMFIFPASIFNGIVTYGLAIIFPFYFGSHDAGFFALAYRIGAFPVALGAQSIGAVIRRDAVEAVSQGAGHLRTVFIWYLRIFLVLSIMYLLVGYSLSGLVISMVFGAGWSESIQMLKIMLPLFALQLCYVSLSQIFLATKKQKIDMYLQFMMGTLMGGTILLSGFWGWDAVKTLKIYTLVGLLSIGFSLYIVCKVGFEKQR